MKHLYPLVTLVLAFSIGWLIRDSFSRPSGDSKPEQSSRQLSSGQNSHLPLRQLAKVTNQEKYKDQVREVIALATTLPVDQIKSWRENFHIDALDGDLEYLFESITSERWLAADPREFLTWSFNTRSQRAGYYLARFSETAPQEALDIARSQSSRLRDVHPNNVIQHLATNKPALARRLIEDNPELLNQRFIFDGIIRTLPQSDLEGFLNLRQSWPSHHQRDSAAAVAAALLKNDFHQTLEFITREGLDWRQLARAASADPSGKIFDSLDLLPPGWLENMVEKSPGFLSNPKALSVFDFDAERVGLSDKGFEKLLMHASSNSFPKEDRSKALGILNNDSLPPKVGKKLLTEQIGLWDRNDLESRQKWIDGITNPDLKAFALKAVENASIHSAVPFHGSPMTKEPAEALRNGELLTTAHQGPWTREQSNAAIAAYHQLPPDEKAKIVANSNNPFSEKGDVGQRQFFAEVYHDRLKKSPNPDDGTLKEMVTFATTWAGTEPALAASWAAELPSGSAREWALKNITRSWQEFSKTETQEWIKTLPPEEQSVLEQYLQSKAPSAE